MNNMLENQLQINIITSKCKCLGEKADCKMSARDSENNCNSNRKALNISMNTYINIIKILIAFILISMVIFFAGYNAGSKLYFQVLKRQEEALQIAQEELSHLKIQMQFVLQSIHKNRISNRSQRSAYHYNNNNSMDSIIHQFFNSSPGRYKRDAEISTLKSSYDTMISILPFPPNQTINQKNMLEKNINNISNNITISSETFGNNLTVNLTNKRQNLQRARKNANVKMQNHKTKEDDISGSGALHNSRRNQRKGREREKKGKRRHIRERRNHNCTQLGPLLVTFVGRAPNYFNKQPGYIKPWINIKEGNSQFEFKKFYLREEHIIEINLNGLYMIFTQIYYEGHGNHSYVISLITEGTSKERLLRKCAVASAASGASCHTSVIIYLQKTDRLVIKQDKGEKYVNMEEGHSQVQLVLLSEEKTPNVE